MDPIENFNWEVILTVLGFIHRSNKPDTEGNTMKDYSVTLRDSTGRIVVLNINADTIVELTNDGYSLDQATACVQDNEFQNAIAKGIIGDDAFII